MMTRWPLFTSLLSTLILAATPAQAVVLTADIFRDAALRYASGQGCLLYTSDAADELT